MKKLILLLFFTIVLSIYGNNERYQIGEGRLQVGMNVGINSYSPENGDNLLRASILGTQNDYAMFFKSSLLELGPKFGRFATDSGGLTFSYGLTDLINISISSPISTIIQNNDTSSRIIGGDTTLSIDYTLELTDFISIIINPTISKNFYNKLKLDSGDEIDFDKTTAMIDYGFNLLVLYQNEDYFADFIFGYHRNEENGESSFENEDYDASDYYPESSQITFSAYLGRVLDETSRIKGGFIYHRVNIDMNGYSFDPIKNTKFECVYSKELSYNRMMDLAFSYINDSEYPETTVLGFNAKFILKF